MSVWYRAGSVTVVNGSETVLGAGTIWQTQASSGDVFVGPDGEFYEIVSVVGNTELTVRHPSGVSSYQGADASGADYAIIRNFTSTTNADLAYRLASLMTKWHGSQDEFGNWLTGTINGGPLSNGKYPMTNPISGVVGYFDCPELIAAVATGARDWAVTDVDVEVDPTNFPGEYSSRHYAVKTQGYVEQILPNIAAIEALNDNIAEVVAVGAVVPDVSTVAANIADVGTVAANAAAIVAAPAAAALAESKAGEASGSADDAAAAAVLAASNSRLTIGTVSTLASGQAATATITGEAGAQVLSLGIPEGDKGDIGDTGRGIASIARTSGTGAAGTTDTYTITFTDSTTTTFSVWNGTDGDGAGDMLKSAYDTDNDGKVNAAEAADSVPWSGVTDKPTLGTAAAMDSTAFDSAGAASSAVTGHELAFDHSLLGAGASFPSYTGNAGKQLTVTSDETGVEWNDKYVWKHVFDPDTVGKRCITSMKPMFDHEGVANVLGTIYVGYCAKDDLFFASGLNSFSYISTSVNGVAWLQRRMPTSAHWIVGTDAYAWIALAQNSTTIAISTDGITWTAGRAVPTNASGLVVKDKYALCFIANSTTAYYSYNYGQPWTASSDWIPVILPVAFQANTERVVNGSFIYRGTDNKYYISSMGTTETWSEMTLPGSSLIYGGNGNNKGLFDGSLFLLYSTALYRSTDGVSWTYLGSNFTSNWFPAINGLMFNADATLGSAGVSHREGDITHCTPLSNPYTPSVGGSATNGQIYVIGGSTKVAVIDPVNGTKSYGLFEV